MTLLNWISSNPDAAIGIVTTVLAYAWNKARGKKTDDLWDTLLKLGQQVIPKLLADSRIYNDAWVNGEIKKAIVAGLGRLKVPLNSATEPLVDEAVEHIHGELAAKLTEYNLGKFIKVQEKTVDELKAAAAT